MGFFGFMRADEFTLTAPTDPDSALSANDVSVDSCSNPSMVKVHLKKSKTDPFIFLGCTNTDLCPVVAILAYYAIRPAAAGPFFQYQDDSPLTRDKLVTAVRLALTEAGVDSSSYSGHSCRVGAATAAKAGITDATIKTLGRWESEAYQRYIRTPRESLAVISRQLAS